MKVITDEDIAEKWLNERYLPDMGIRKPCKDAFLAGLKAGRPKWHDLRKNPLDLPTENCTVLIYTDWQGMELKTFFVDTRLFENLTFHEVIAWCEIPKFEEK